MRVQKQVQLFDELMLRTKEKHKMIYQLHKQQINTDTSGNTRSATSKIAELETTSGEPYRTIISNMEICESTDEYGRNIARIQVPRSILYENAIEIKKFDEKDNNDDDDDDDDDDNDDGDEGQNDDITIQ